LTAINALAATRSTDDATRFDPYTCTLVEAETIRSPEGERWEVELFTTSFTYRHLAICLRRRFVRHLRTIVVLGACRITASIGDTIQPCAHMLIVRRQPNAVTYDHENAVLLAIWPTTALATTEPATG
jgi:hypothetical protein